MEILERKNRHFLPEDFELTSWDSIKTFYEELSAREITSSAELEKWFADRSELDSFLSENMAWRYIRMTCDTTDEKAQEDFRYFVEEIQPPATETANVLNHKVIGSPFANELHHGGYEVMLRGIRKAAEIFREENISLETQIQMRQTAYQSATGAMTVELNDEEMTLPKAAGLLLSVNRSLREEAWMKIEQRRLSERENLDEVFDDLVQLRTKVARNAGFENFRDYMFDALGRFDYSPQDCFDFHSSVTEAVVPLLDRMAGIRKKRLGLSEYRPWDAKTDDLGRPALKPFRTGEELLDKTEVCFEKISPELKRYIRIMRNMGHFDVESRKGKAPGGYNYPLEETGVPFIFMNATDSLRDLVTMVHEGGHAAHSFEVRDLPLSAFRNPPAEVAELASMSMELISMEHWDVFFEDKKELRRAKIQHLEDILTVLPWIAAVDKFQHRVYENPGYSAGERRNTWSEIYSSFSDSVTCWEGLEGFRENAWQKQLHIFEVPFYYIEYGMAQLGAISVWRNYKRNPEEALQQYLKALKLGYTVTIEEVYQAAGVRFDFSREWISELMAFVSEELLLLESQEL